MAIFTVLRCLPCKEGLPAFKTKQKGSKTLGCCLSCISFDVSTSRNIQNSNILHYKVWLLGNCRVVKCTPFLSLWQLIQMKQVVRSSIVLCGRWERILMASGRMSSDANADFLPYFMIACWWSGAVLLTLSRTIFSLSDLFQKGSHWWVIFHYY